MALFEAGLLYLVGVFVVWTIAGRGLDVELWEILATLVVFGMFVAPGGPTRSHFFHLGGEHIRLAGFCGIAGSAVLAVLVAALVAVLGPGTVGVVIAARRDAPVTSAG